MRREAEDKRQMMEETPMGRLLWKMSGPSVIGIMAYNLYNVFDTVLYHGEPERMRWEAWRYHFRFSSCFLRYLQLWEAERLQ